LPADVTGIRPPGAAEEGGLDVAREGRAAALDHQVVDGCAWHLPDTAGGDEAIDAPFHQRTQRVDESVENVADARAVDRAFGCAA
jgi:hypothetical protein